MRWIDPRARALTIGITLAGGVLAIDGCQPAVGRLSWEIVFADPALGMRAARVEGRILTGGCSSTSVRYAAEAGRGETPPMPPRLEAGRYGLEGRARDASCIEFATGCVDVELPRDDGMTIRVTLAASSERALCPGAMCASGACGAADAGPADAGDTGPGDTGPGDAGPGDAGTRDTGAPDAFADDAGSDAGCSSDAECGECGACTLGACGPALEGTSCRAAAGACHAGACCTGCWDGTACQGGDTSAACGVAGGSCAACAGAAPICEATSTCGVGRTVSAVAVGTAFACALATDGTLWCWGDDLKGQLGQGVAGAGTELDAPTRVGSSSSWSRVGLGDEHVCASQGALLYCWGDDEDGQIGFADNVSRYAPSLVTSAIGPWERIEGARTGDGTCTLDAAGVVTCMGQNDYGQLGVGDNVDHAVLTPRSAAWRSISHGHRFTCGVQTDDTLWCAGQNEAGQLGNGTSGAGTESNVPARVGTGAAWSTVAAGQTHACAIQSGQLWCWGAGTDGRLGLGSTAPSSSPVRVGTASDWASVAAGAVHTCGIRAGALYCWGQNLDGELGLGAPSADRTTPVRVGTDGDWESVHAGAQFTCGLRAGSQLYCWGLNTSGQLGVGDATMRASPTRVYLPGR